MPVSEIVQFVVLGLFVSIYGSLVGAGGGFIIVPVLLLFFASDFSTQQAAGTSLLVVLFNGLSATYAFAKQKRIDYATGVRFAAATVPSAFIGGLVAEYFDSAAFKATFGFLLIAVAIFLNLRPDPAKAKALADPDKPLPSGFVRRVMIDAKGNEVEYAFNLRNGIIFCFGIGFLASILGVGGGIFLVPAMVFLFGFPAHYAAATSSFVLIFTAAAGLIPHTLNGNIVWLPGIAMTVGGIAGAQIGARLAQRVRGKIILRLLSLGMAVAGIQLIRKAFGL
jgi:uncharacterized membrane protein YfcA